MHQITLSSKTDIHKAIERIQQTCDERGVRLGKSPEAAERILCAAFNVKDINTLHGLVKKQTVNSSGDNCGFNETLRTAPYARMSEYQGTVEIKAPEDAVFDVKMLKNPTPRTLLFGYDVDRNTIHVYLDECGHIHYLKYNYITPPNSGEDATGLIKPVFKGIAIEHQSGSRLNAQLLIPNKRAFPCATDVEFTEIMGSLGLRITFTNNRDKQMQPFEGLLADEVLITSKAALKLAENLNEFESAYRRLCWYKETKTDFSEAEIYFAANDLVLKLPTEKIKQLSKLYDYKAQAFANAGYLIKSKERIPTNIMHIIEKAYDEFMAGIDIDNAAYDWACVRDIRSFINHYKQTGETWDFIENL